MNSHAPWSISAGLHAAAIGAAAYFGAAAIVAPERMEIRLQKGKTVVEIQASIATSAAPQSVAPPVRVKPPEKQLPREPQAQAVEIVRRDPMELRRPADDATAPPPSPVSAAPPQAARVEIEADESAITPPPRPTTIDRIHPVSQIEVSQIEVSQIEATAVAASSGSNVTIDDSPMLLESPTPPYPPDAYAARIEGVVKLDVLVDVRGRVREVSILESSGSVSLDHAALRTVRDSWRFKIHRPAGVPTPYYTEVPVRFRIKS
jgi:protein TonB